jgi:exopolysaccharide biosynthesis polyprenyl glycosylphosphotransferase
MASPLQPLAPSGPAAAAPRPRLAPVEGRRVSGPVAVVRDVPARHPPRANGRLFVRLCRATDLAVAVFLLLLVFVASNAGRMPGGLDDFLTARLTVENILVLLAFATLWRLICLTVGLYEWKYVRRRADEVRLVLLAATLGAVPTLAFPLLSDSGAFPFIMVAWFWATLVAGLLATRAIARWLAAARYVGDAREVLIVGSGPRALALFEELRHAGAGGQVIGFVDTNERVASPEIASRLLGSLDQLERILMYSAIDEVLIALPVRSHYAQIQQVIDLCERVGVPARHLADVFSASRPWTPRDDLTERYALGVSVAPDDYRLAIKRAIDITGGLLALVILSPVLLAAAIAVRLSGPGPIIFAQSRYGLNRRPFRMYKFRTMVADAEAIQPLLEHRNEAGGPVFKISNDPRITPVGRFLRKLSIDELPQLINVLRGEMSLVGPRPLPARDVQRFTESALMRRFSVRPGLTGLWQVSGRSELDFGRWIALDLRYIDQWSLGLDLRILLKTVPVVLRGTGAV